MMRKLITVPLPVLSIMALVGCLPQYEPSKTHPRPAEAYAHMVRGASAGAPLGFRSPPHRTSSRQGAAATDELGARAQLHLVSHEDTINSDDAPEPEFRVQQSTVGNRRQYRGPLQLGDPGVSASLWQESRASNDLLRDYRAYQPMDLITIVVSESSEGKKSADTATKSESTLELAIESLLGLEDQSSHLNPSSLANASSTNEFTGEGETNRKDSLKARISAMVVEVLPSGVLRVEGEKIIAVNSEEQTMVISGLVRLRDVNSDNEVDSSKIANMRIDYYGSGIIGEAQQGGWLGRIIRKVWPF